MLPGIGGLEYLLIAILALVVIGPKDLPMLMRKAGAFLNRLRAMAAEFRASFDEMARQSELDELRKQVEELRSGQLMQPITAEIAPAMTEIESDIRAGTSIDWTGIGSSAAATPIEEPDTQGPPTPARKRAGNKAAGAAKPTAARPRPAAAKPAAKPAKASKPDAKPAAKPARKPAAKAAPAKAARARPKARGAKA